jgi:glycosyltransferase involved in cell wall biosynthesis
VRVLIIIPAYNEAENICNVVESIKSTVPGIDYLVINDCSKDDTEQVCKTHGYQYISLPANLGIGGAVQAGYLYALQHGYDIAIQIDGDGQHDPAYIRDLIQPIINGEADIAIGSRFITKEGFQSSGSRRLGIYFLSTVIRICCGLRILDVTSGFRAVNRKFIKFYAKNYAQDYPEPEAIIAAAMNGGRIKEIPVIMRERKSGKSSINVWRSLYYMLKVTLAISLYRITNQKEIGA